MPKVKTVSVNYERKINLGDYSSATIGCQIWADIETDFEGDPVEDLDTCMRQLWTCAKNNVRAQTIPLLKNQNGSDPEAIPLGLPDREVDNG